MAKWFVSAVLLVSMGLAWPGPATADWSRTFTPRQAHDARERGTTVPLRQIFSRLKRRYGGYQIDANLHERNGQQVYVIKWMTDEGKRIRLLVDARSGRRLN
ncbi:MAG: hypothetical protein CME93_01825 [Hyphomonadaceae bacterium]|nr:hypothetical protein [Hyphomonadaceae bacterium]OUX95839.1 MAG: hypothetical protein CBB77_01560 [Hyphomonas sp. TMED17]